MENQTETSHPSLLSGDTWNIVFTFCSQKSLLNIGETCKELYEMTRDPTRWTRFANTSEMKNYVSFERFLESVFERNNAQGFIEEGFLLSDFPNEFLKYYNSDDLVSMTSDLTVEEIFEIFPSSQKLEQINLLQNAESSNSEDLDEVIKKYPQLRVMKLTLDSPYVEPLTIENKVEYVHWYCMGRYVYGGFNCSTSLLSLSNTLQHLILENYLSSNFSYEKVLSSIKCLKTLDININGFDMTKVLKLIVEHQCNHIRTLSLHGSIEIKTGFDISYVQHLKKIESFSADYCVNPVAKMLVPTLKHLDLKFDESESNVEFLNDLSKNCYLNTIKIQVSKRQTVALASCIFDIKNENNVIQELSISNCTFPFASLWIGNFKCMHTIFLNTNCLFAYDITPIFTNCEKLKNMNIFEYISTEKNNEWKLPNQKDVVCRLEKVEFEALYTDFDVHKNALDMLFNLLGMSRLKCLSFGDITSNLKISSLLDKFESLENLSVKMDDRFDNSKHTVTLIKQNPMLKKLVIIPCKDLQIDWSEMSKYCNHLEHLETNISSDSELKSILQHSQKLHTLKVTSPNITESSFDLIINNHSKQFIHLKIYTMAEINLSKIRDLSKKCCGRMISCDLRFSTKDLKGMKELATHLTQSSTMFKISHNPLSQ